MYIYSIQMHQCGYATHTSEKKKKLAYQTSPTSSHARSSAVPINTYIYIYV